jgi:hypothetical protein
MNAQMLSAKLSPGRPRWPRGQKFTLTAAGTDAEAEYRAAVLGARASGRAALEAALSAWAGPRGVAPGDGVLLAELSGKRLGLTELVRSLESAGIEPEEVRASVRRLVEAGIAEAVPLATQLS